MYGTDFMSIEARSRLSRRAFLETTVAVGVAGFLPRSLVAVNDGVSRKPNIILIMADDLGYECIGANGGVSYETPVLDKLAAEGVRFEHCYSQPLCTPSRVQLMTGMYNVRNYTRFGRLQRNQTTFAHPLKRAGYATCVVGKWQLGKEKDSPRHFGFDESCLWQHRRGRTDEKGHDTRFSNPRLEINGEFVNYTNGEYGPDVVSDYACDFIGRAKGRPFLLYYPMILTHCPFTPTPDSPDWDPESMGSKSYKGNAKYFGDMVAYTDKIVGKLVAKLEELGHRENTLILFTGDNGTDEPVVSEMNSRKVAGGKGSTTDAGTRVLLVANWPGTISDGRICRDLIDFSDFVPTICDILGVTIPEELKIDGRSFLPQLMGTKDHPRDWIYCWYSRSGNAEKAKEFARNQRYKLYRSGEFYDVQNDVLEKKSLTAVDMDNNARQARAMLQRALDQYSNARPANRINK
jgi:arylsulfatase A